jgi:signal transduction histidine kinase
MVPLRVGDSLAGVMSVDHGALEHRYTPDEIALVRAAGRLVTLVLERERLLHERAEAQAHVLALREANRRMEEFLSIAGHELRTPLTSVLGNVQLATKWVDMMQHGTSAGAPPERLAHVQMVLRRMERQGRVLNRLVNDLLDTSRIQFGRLALRPAPCDLAALVRDVVQEYQQQAPQRTLRLETVAVALPVVADAARLAQVLSNYLSNALKFSPPDQTITVGLRVIGAVARVSVRDHGPGLPRAEHDRIWERFYRVADMAHQDGSSEGLGLGLHISRNIVERHGGRVGVESDQGAGATFWFTIPLAQPGGDRP